MNKIWLRLLALWMAGGVCVAVADEGEPLGKGVAAFEERDFEEAYEVLRPLAEEGDPRAQLFLARIFEQEKAPAEALNVGGKYRYSRPAVRWYRRAAENGNAEAMNALAVHHGQGWKHLEEDPDRAVELLRRASEAGYGKASYNLYALQRNRGHGEQARDMLFRAAEQGMAKAQNRLGMLYATGKEGLDQDFRAAEKWLSRAAKQGHKPAQATLPTVRRQLEGDGDGSG